MKREFKYVRPKVDETNQCHRCKKFYNDKDVAILEEGPVCLNCLDTKNPEDIKKMLKVGFQQEDIMTIRNLQYIDQTCE
jgi:recombinational DNA repair protein (RecF pathway)